MSKPLVSIVLPTYNGARYLAGSIQSCIDQTYPNWELIVVDDCSTDDTPSIISEFTALDPRIRSVRHPVNYKLPAALNTGFGSARGDYWTWTSDDNEYRPQAIERMLYVLEGNAQIGLVYCDFTKITADKEHVQFNQVPDPEHLVFNNCIGACFLYRSKAAKHIGLYNEGLFLAEDYDYWLRLSQVIQLAPLHENLYLYRTHADTLTSKRRKEAQAVATKVLARNLPLIKWPSKRMLAKGYMRLFYSSWSENNLRTRWWHLLAAARYSPIVAIDETFGRKLRLLTRRLSQLIG